MTPERLLFSGHAVRRMFERGISEGDVQLVVSAGETIADYADDTPYPSRLILGFVNGRPIHVVVADAGAQAACVVITAYIPEEDQWSPDYRKRRVE